MAAIEGYRRQRGFALPLAIRFFLATALLILLAVSAAIVVTYVQGQRVAARAIGKTLSTSVAAQREFEQHRLEQLELSLRLVASDASFVKYIADANSSSNLPGLGGDAAPDTMSMRDLLGDRQKDIGFSLGILLDGKGEVLARTDQADAFTESLAADPLVAPALAEARPLSGYWRQNDKLFQAAIVPLAQDQNVVGFLLLAQTVDDELARKVAQVSGAEIAFWMPLAGKPALIASSFDSAAASQLRETVKSSPGLPSAASAADGTHIDLGGQDWVARMAPTAAADAAELGQLMVLASSDQVVASYRAILNSVVLGGLVTLLLALPLSYLISKGILRPVSAMASAAEQAAAGNFQTRLGTAGQDELARLARAFDSLLSDLREKSDMEGYVGNLARFLPEPGQEGSGVVVHTQPLKQSTPPRRDALVLLGLEYRQLLSLPAHTPPEQVLEEKARIQTRLAAAAAAADGVLLAAPGGRWTLAFPGPQRLLHALQLLRDEFAQAAPPAAALADGDLVLSEAGEGSQLVGAAQVQIDRLLCDAAPGQVLAGRSTGESLRSEYGSDSVAVATGGFSSKQFYAPSAALLQRLPHAEAPERLAQDNDTVPRGSAAITPRSAAAARSLRDSGELAPGSTLGGRYRVLSVLGAGGMGVVYKAHDLELDDVVALKMLKPGALLDAEQLDRLKSEIKLARRITHPNVLRTFDFGEVNGLPYISMEYVRGMTLRYLLREAKRVPYSAGLRIARQLAAGLAAAHEVGVLHRDIKPENLILEANGNAKLMDFGIARPARRATPGHTQPGTFLGTPNYCAPEQLAGEEVDEGADIYACGVLMTEMFCGALPYSGSNTMEIYMAQMQQEPARPSVLWPEIRPELETLILSCLKRNRAERPASAAELAASLTQLRA
ncbi:serine/threonine-protein kinase [Tahibacter aquaticus]|uniref:non-specific serine/threonine protein kinase n=1 Tax=Tahibacter aquaticus TaxID=520092 RepID=A0A4R6YNH4_9GAMM|nr:serine/threonine-protein kinase [Tahibacter aquaticus]TDR39152.1 serine/threonine-protein kinase [Tahibacter aquaticus]